MSALNVVSATPSNPGASWRIFASPVQTVSPVHWGWWALCYIVAVATFVAVFGAYAAVFIWPPNGILLAGLLLLRRADAIRLLIVAFACSLAAHFALYPTYGIAVVHAALDMAAPMAAAAITRRVCGAALDLGRPRRLFAFGALAVVPVCFAKAAIESIVSPLAGVDMFEAAYVTFIVDSFGMLLVVPFAIQLSGRPSAGFAPDRPRETVATLILAVAVSIGAVSQATAPMQFLVLVPVLLAALRLSIRATLVIVTIALAIFATGTLFGYGPITLARIVAESARDLSGNPIGARWPVLQLFTATMIGVALSVSAASNERRRTTARLDRRGAAIHAALLSVRAAKQQVVHDALHDSATGLMNRGGLIRAISCAAPDDAGRPWFGAALIVDRFASFQTAIGIDKAARLIALSAERIRDAMPDVLVARTAHDTIKIALRASDHDAAEERVEAIVALFMTPVTVDGVNIDVRFTIGIADTDRATVMLHRAHIAAEQARAKDLRLCWFRPEVEAAAATSLTLLSDLYHGLESGDVWLSYQPKVDLRSGAVDSAECLIRWNHPRHGAIGPDRFIPIAEQTGFIEPLTDWVLAEAARASKTLSDRGIPIEFSVNLSVRSLVEPHLAQRLQHIVEGAGVRPSQFTIEITETGIMRRGQESMRTLQHLKSVGFRVSIDDFGTGQSSMRYLRQLSADELKIDHSFVAQAAWDSKDAMMVRAMIDLAHGLGLEVVAEGVENEETLSLIRLLGCDSAQGFHIARPMRFDALVEWLDRRVSILQPLPAAPLATEGAPAQRTGLA